MLQSATPITYFKATKAAAARGGKFGIRSGNMPDNDYNSDDDDFGGGKHRNKSRRELPAGAVATLKAWLLSPEHFTHPYPTPQDQVMLMQKTGIDKKQLKNWFTNARRRIWKPMLKKQLEQGKLAATGTGGVAMNGVGVVPGMMVMQGQIPGQTEQVQYHTQQQQPIQSVQEIQIDQYGNQIYQPQQVATAPAPQYYDTNTGPSINSSMVSQPAPASQGPPAAALAPSQPMNKTDSHAVLMELFARDQDLVRQATESAAKKAAGLDSQSLPAGQPIGSEPQLGGPTHQHAHGQQNVSSQQPMKTPSSGRLVSVPTLNSWPHFSSVSSLNNLGTMPGVKSITSLSAADLVKQGAVNSVGNLAQVKSVESLGKNDSYAFLEVFFGDRSSNALSSMGGNGPKDQRGVKRERDEDNDVGLSLEDESPSASAGHSMRQETVGSSHAQAPTSDFSSNPFSVGNPASDSTDTLKRAYDDAMAARGLISVSRSSEKLTDLALPAKIQRTLSQELLRKPKLPPQQQQHQSYVQYQYTPAPVQAVAEHSNGNGQYPAQPTAQSGQGNVSGQSSDAGGGTSVAVPSATKCAICHKTNVDTQLRPCGHMFHEQCLKPALQACMGAPKCPVDHIPMQSALLAIPTDENAKPRPTSNAMSPHPSSWSGAEVHRSQAVSDGKD